MEINSLNIQELNPSENNIKELPNIEYQIKDENNISYILKIFQGDNSIKFTVNEIGDICKIVYKNDLSLQDFYNSNRIFRQYISIEELFNLFIKSLQQSEIIINKNNNKIMISFIVEFRGKKDNIPFILEQKETKIEDIVMNLCQKIKEMEIMIKEQIIENNNKIREQKIENANKIRELEQKLNEKDIIINNLINRINSLEKNINELNIKNEQIIKEITEQYEIIMNPNNSLIIKKDELYLIEEGIKKNYNKNIKKYELLLRGSRDGFGVKTFHQKCDGKSLTLTLVKTTDNKRFGGFTEAAWDQSDSWKKGPNSFIFSLDKKEIYYIKKDKYSIYCYPETNPNFLGFGKGHDFKLYNNCNISDLSYDKSGDSYETNGKKNTLADKCYFKVKDYEIYKIYI